MRLRTALPAAVAGLLLTLTGCTSFADSVAASHPSAAPAASSGSTAPAPVAAPIDWTDCNRQIQPLIAGQPGADRGLSFECGRTEVPISYAEPQGAALPL